MGAGRPAGSLNKATMEQTKRLSDIAVHAEDALATLVARNGGPTLPGSRGQRLIGPRVWQTGAYTRSGDN